ncbi:hypothetical protein EDD86DRAFT_232412 [Gorgonomyces haynaldii]|nr:hypothetical protein EDD86DRAFT_232412 [Gorgonomyces haynaldii]
MLLLIPAVLAQGPSNACQTLPPTVDCLVGNAQYTVLGRVTGTNLGDPQFPQATASNFNATVAIDCVFASFDSPPSSGIGLAGNSVTVTGWGSPKPGCPAGYGAPANINQTALYFFYVARPGTSPIANLYGVNYICVGGIPATQDNLTKLAQLLAQSPANAIAPAYKGSSPTCNLPALPTSTGAASPSVTATVPNSASTAGTLFSLLFALL